MKLCFGALFKVLYQIKKSGTKPELYSVLLEPWLSEQTVHDPSDVTKRANGTDNLPRSEKEAFLQRPLDDIRNGYKNYFKTYFKENMFKAVIVAIQKILLSDPIDDATSLGGDGYTKSKVLNSDTFHFVDLITHLMRYCCDVDNNFKSDIEEIKQDFVSTCIEESKAITLEDDISEIITPLKSTIRVDDFKNAFVELELSDDSLHLQNPSKLKLFRPNIENKQFDYLNMQVMIKRNIGRYVFSRTKRQKYESEGLGDSIGLEAMNEITRNVPDEKMSESFGEIMLYSFMESVLKAPKILSAFEVKNIKNVTNAKSSGIYFLPAGTINEANQIVFGSSKVADSLEDATNECLNKVQEIIQNKQYERQLVDVYSLNKVMPAEERQFMESVIVPSKANKPKEYAFGIFITYKAKDIQNKDISNQEYIDRIKESMVEDITSISTYIKSKIKEFSLDNYSFYLFFLPLYDGEEDSKVIMKAALRGDLL